MDLSSPRGTIDIYGEDIDYRNYIINTAREILKIFSFAEIITPAFEYTNVFSRSIGEDTDIVQKQMYTFADKKGRSLTLRPEGTASIVRAVLENKIYSEKLPLKLFYIGNMFRYEKPQKGRMREFWQFGIESIGSDNPIIDAEAIWILNLFFEKLGFKKLILKINNIGCSKCRKKFLEEFKKYLKPEIEKLCSDCRKRFKENPLRIFDCKKTNCREVLTGSPDIYYYLCSECKKKFEEILMCLKSLDIKYKIDKSLVRGFDYYTGSIFEIISENLESAQNALGGGGRYDNLISELGGPDIPATGFAVGIDRTIILMKQLNIDLKKSDRKSKVYLIAMDRNSQIFSIRILKYLREKEVVCDINFNIRSLKKEIKWARDNGYNFIIIVGEDEIKSGNLTIKDIDKFKQYKVDWKNKKEKIIEIIGA
ncbi:MAG: histidine--tRNA ligase [Actinomycetota bacterium]